VDKVGKGMGRYLQKFKGMWIKLEKVWVDIYKSLKECG
jgi:hypothetical protein